MLPPPRMPPYCRSARRRCTAECRSTVLPAQEEVPLPTPPPTILPAASTLKPTSGGRKLWAPGPNGLKTDQDRVERCLGEYTLARIICLLKGLASKKIKKDPKSKRVAKLKHLDYVIYKSCWQFCSTVKSKLNVLTFPQIHVHCTYSIESVSA